MARVECPRDCPGLLQAPFELPGTGGRVQHAYCPECRGQFPELDGRFEAASGQESRQGPKPEEKLRLERNAFFRDVLGFAVWDLEQGHRPDGSRQTRGLPDTFLAGHGLTIWIEYKDTGRKQTEYQVDFERHVTANGGLYHVIWPETSIKAILEEWETHPDWRDEP